MALIFSYSCPGGGRKNGDTIARPSMFQKAQVSWEEKKFLADYLKRWNHCGLRDQRIFAAIYVTEGRISIRVICNMRKRLVFTYTSFFRRLRFIKTLALE